jgi:type IV pilus assembly protein PilV
VTLVVKSKGFTLIEVLIALVILSISLLGVASLMITTTKNNSFGSHMTEGTTLIQDKFEELLVTRWEDIDTNNDIVMVRGSSGISYSRNWSVVPGAAFPNRKKITVTINWNDGIAHSIDSTSWMYRYRWRDLKD